LAVNPTKNPVILAVNPTKYKKDIPFPYTQSFTRAQLGGVASGVPGVVVVLGGVAGRGVVLGGIGRGESSSVVETSVATKMSHLIFCFVKRSMPELSQRKVPSTSPFFVFFFFFFFLSFTTETKMSHLTV
jgi:hypothetical protein